MAPPSQELEPPANPERFNPLIGQGQAKCPKVLIRTTSGGRTADLHPPSLSPSARPDPAIPDSSLSLALKRETRCDASRDAQHVRQVSCQVVAHCWDPVGHAIVTRGYLFER